jgi:hypothetical protein
MGGQWGSWDGVTRRVVLRHSLGSVGVGRGWLNVLSEGIVRGCDES